MKNKNVHDDKNVGYWKVIIKGPEDQGVPAPGMCRAWCAALLRCNCCGGIRNPGAARDGAQAP